MTRDGVGLDKSDDSGNAEKQMNWGHTKQVR